MRPGTMLPPPVDGVLLEELEAAAGARDTLPPAGDVGEDGEGGGRGAMWDDAEPWPMGGAWGGGAW